MLAEERHVTVDVAWYNRRQLDVDLVASIKRTLDRLAELHSSLREWYAPPYELPAVRDHSGRFDNLEGRVAQGHFYAGEKPLFSGGISITLDSGPKEASAHSLLTFAVGGVVISRRKPALAANAISFIEELYSLRRGSIGPQVRLAILNALIDIWQPVEGCIRGVVANQIATNTVPPDPLPPGYAFPVSRPPLPGWAVYLNSELATQTSGPSDVEVSKRPDGGQIWIAERESYDVNDPGKIARIAAIDRALEPIRRAREI